MSGPRIGQRVGAFLVQAERLRTASRVHYDGVHAALSRPVSLELILQPPAQALLANPQVQPTLGTLSNLRHPHLNELVAVEQFEGCLCLVRARPEGPTLEEQLSQGPLPLEGAGQVALDLLDALALVHAQGLIHGRIHPRWIRLTREGVKLDGPEVGEDPIFEQQIEVAAFIAPERRAGEPLSAATEVYALGICLYQALTGLLPQPRNRDMPDPRHRRPELPTWLAEAVEGATRRDPLTRFADAAEMRRVCRALAGAGVEPANGEPEEGEWDLDVPTRIVEPAPPEAEVPAERPASRRPSFFTGCLLLSLVGLIGVAALLALAVALMWWAGRTAVPEIEPVEVEVPVEAPEAEEPPAAPPEDTGDTQPATPEEPVAAPEAPTSPRPPARALPPLRAPPQRPAARRRPPPTRPPPSLQRSQPPRPPPPRSG